MVVTQLDPEPADSRIILKAECFHFNGEKVFKIVMCLNL